MRVKPELIKAHGHSEDPSGGGGDKQSHEKSANQINENFTIPMEA